MTLLALDNTLIRVSEVESAYAEEDHSPYGVRIRFKTGNVLLLKVDYIDFIKAFTMAVSPNLAPAVQDKIFAMIEEGLPTVILDE